MPLYSRYGSSKPARTVKNSVKKSATEPLPSGSGFARLVGKRADRNNLPGRVNDAGDRITGPMQTNKQRGRAGFGGRAHYFANPRAGKQYLTGLTKSGRTVHIYGSGERVVVPKKAAKFKRY